MNPYYDDGQVVVYHGDCLDVLPQLDSVALVLTDPPNGTTSLSWDSEPDSTWLFRLPANNLWCFGPMRHWLAYGDVYKTPGWRYSQEVIWRKHNGSGFHADRFRRVHELVVHWYRGPWGKIYKDPQTTPEATARTVRRKRRPTHAGHIESGSYVSEDGGPRLMRSVIDVRSEHGRAVHPTQKPLGILTPLIQYSCPPGGTVLDPFMGSGSTLLAARQTSRRAIGIEAREDYCEAAVKRLAQTEMVA